MLLDVIGGARPNFIKIAPILEALDRKIAAGYDFEYRLIHTGQHYDKTMSGLFFEQLGIKNPDINLNAGGGSHAVQTANIITRYEKVLKEKRPDLVVVVGDVNSTLACSLAAKKLCNIPIAHVEAGIRSGDRNMPEEVNRLVTDILSDYFFTPCKSANYNLLQAGVSPEKIFYVGNTMIDTLVKYQNQLIQPSIWNEKQLENKNYLVMTLHRQSNLDNVFRLHALVKAVSQSAGETPVIFPVHPHTNKILKRYQISAPNIHMIEPMGYLEFNYLVKNAMGVITDSGGITEETTVMNVPCITLRDSTERPDTCTVGTNELIGVMPTTVGPLIKKLKSGRWKEGKAPELWDGQTAQRIVDVLMRELSISKVIRKLMKAV